MAASTRDAVKAADAAEAFVREYYRRRELSKLQEQATGGSYTFWLDCPSPIGFQLERAASVKARQYSIDGEIPVRDDSHAWHRALGGSHGESGADPVLSLMETIWQSLPGRHRALLEWSEGYGDEAGEDGQPLSYALMAVHVRSRGWVADRCDALVWVRNELHRARVALCGHVRMPELRLMLAGVVAA